MSEAGPYCFVMWEWGMGNSNCIKEKVTVFFSCFFLDAIDCSTGLWSFIIVDSYCSACLIVVLMKGLIPEAS